MKYFNAAMRDLEIGMIKANGSGQFVGHQYVTEHTVNFDYQGDPIFVHWKIVFEDDILVSIENINSVADDGTYEKTLLQFINEVLQKSLSEQKDKFFVRQVYLTISGGSLLGEYWLPGFRLAPLFPEDNSTLYDDERAIVIDQEVQAIDKENAKEIGILNASKYSAFMSYILNTGLYHPTIGRKYFLKKDEEGFKMERESTQFLDPTRISKMPKKKEICSLGEFKGSIKTNIINTIIQGLTCPKETRKILRGNVDAHENISRAFEGCCYLYQVALNAGRHYPTVKLSYMCGAVEAIVKSNVEEYKSFSDFMKRYANTSKELCDLIYKVRSSHWHSGQFEFGDHDYDTWDISDSSRLVKSNIKMIAELSMRNSINQWLFEVLEISKPEVTKE